MKHKTNLFALAAISASMLALPALASAGTWVTDGVGAGTALTFSSLGSVKLTTASGNTVECASSTGAGKYATTSTGSLTLKFHTCKDVTTNSTCTSAGQPSGTIVTTELTFNQVYLENPKKSPGLTLKGNGANEHFATFTCFLGSIKVEVFGTVLGEVEEEATRCGVATKKLPINFTSSAAGQQTWKQVTTEGSIEDLTMATNGGTPETASLDGTGFTETGANVTPTCTS